MKSGHIVDAIDRAAVQRARPWLKPLAVALVASLVVLSMLGGGLFFNRPRRAPLLPQPPLVNRLPEPVDELAVVAERDDEPDADSAPVPLRWTGVQLVRFSTERVLVASPGRMRPVRVTSVMWRSFPADVFARYHRLHGNAVLTVVGTDEHGTPVMVVADKEGVSPRETADKYNEQAPRRLPSSRAQLRPLHPDDDSQSRLCRPGPLQDPYERGFVFEQTALGAFSATTGNTLPDRYIEGTCPICGFSRARGDQCDNCGNQLDPVDLIEPRSTIDGTAPEFRETNHLYLDLPKFREQLIEWIESKDDWRPNVRSFSLSSPARSSRGRSRVTSTGGSGSGSRL